jgi:hypothetical protein
MGSILSRIEDNFDEVKTILEQQINVALSANDLSEVERLKNTLHQSNPRYMKTGQRLNNSRYNIII